MIWRVHFADGPLAYNEGEVFCATPRWDEARDLAIRYLEEEHRWERCGFDNLWIERWTSVIPAGSTMLFTD